MRLARATHSASVMGGLVKPNKSVMVLPKSVFRNGGCAPSGSATSCSLARNLSHCWSLNAAELGANLMVRVETPGRDKDLISSMDWSSEIFLSIGLVSNSSTFDAVAPGNIVTNWATRVGIVGSSCWPRRVYATAPQINTPMRSNQLTSRCSTKYCASPPDFISFEVGLDMAC